MMAFAALALTIFMEKAANDLLVEIRAADASRMRLEAYSAMETTLGVLEDYRAALGGLRSPAEGWADPLGFAGYEYAGDYAHAGINPDFTVEVAFEDESGKLSLPNANVTTLTSLFKYWELDETTSNKLADALLGWMRPDYIPATAGAPLPEDYDSGDLPFTPPARTLRTFDELASIEFARDIFYDETGRPNDLWRRFVQTFSLYDFQTPNINAAPPDILGALGNLDPSLDQKLAAFLRGEDGHTAATGATAGYFASKDEINTLLGAGTPASQLGVTISALRVIVTVRQGEASYRLNALVAMPGSGGAKIPASWTQQPAGKNQPDASSNNNVTPGNQGVSRTNNNPNITRANAAPGSTQKNLNYPYTYLEICENDQIPPPAPTITETTPQ
jgi:general secretion pathway protein K